MEEEQVVLKEKRYLLENLSHLKVGDPFYFEEKTGLHLTFSKPVKGIVRTEMDIAEVEHTYIGDWDNKEHSYRTIEVNVYASGTNLNLSKEENAKLVDSYLKNTLSDKTKEVVKKEFWITSMMP